MPRYRDPPTLDTIQRALDHPRKSLDAIADALRVAPATLKVYRLGRRALPPQHREALAAYLEEHAREAKKLAAMIRPQTSTSEPPGEDVDAETKRPPV